MNMDMDTVSPTAAPNVSLSDAATLVALTLKRTTNKSGQLRTRVGMSHNTFRRLTGRRVGGAAFVRGFTKELMKLGWLMVRTSTGYGFIRADSLDKWALTKSAVVAEELKLIGEGLLSEVLERARQELSGPGDVDPASVDASELKAGTASGANGKATKSG
ncbi:hypothetical protein NKK52_17600 [Mesorhizobium sp. C277A]|uniref:hypothetical protein n=1 Tax=unclassified Mesorhizobium TaxID=325217 RepID=UPI0012EB4FCE|nr:hypothetical protein [Mesorhizobium sp. LSJC277A00]